MNALTKAPEQRTAEWFAQRVGMVTGSRVGAILGVSPFAKRDDVMREMVREALGEEREFKGNKFTQWGEEHEQDAITAFEEETGIFVKEAPFVPHPEINWIGASPDGFTTDGGLIETKCPQKIKTLDEVPHYIAQMQLQMHCTGTFHCYFVQWQEGDLSIDKIERDEKWLDDNYFKLREFRNEFNEILASEEKQQEYIEPLVVDHEGDPAWELQAKALVDLNASIKELQAQEKELKAKLIELANGKKSQGCGVSVFPVSRKSVDYKRLLKDQHLSVDGYEKESVSWTARVQ